jgi:Na+-driven multidrug efflux pump
LVINIWAGIFVAQSLARSIWIVAENLQRYRLLIQMAVAAGNVLGNMYLIPVMGIKGAALASLFSQCLGTWGLTMFFKPLRASTISMIKAINPTNIFRPSKEKAVAWN